MKVWWDMAAKWCIHERLGRKEHVCIDLKLVMLLSQNPTIKKCSQTAIRLLTSLSLAKNGQISSSYFTAASTASFSFSCVNQCPHSIGAFFYLGNECKTSSYEFLFSVFDYVESCWSLVGKSFVFLLFFARWWYFLLINVKYSLLEYCCICT